VHQSTAIPYREKKTLWNFLQENSLLLKYDAPTDPTNGVFSEWKYTTLLSVAVFMNRGRRRTTIQWTQVNTERRRNPKP
jgi:hypothetical protein